MRLFPSDFEDPRPGNGSFAVSDSIVECLEYAMRWLVLGWFVAVTFSSAAAQEKTAAVLRHYDTAVTLQNHRQFNQAADQWTKFIDAFPHSKFLPEAMYYRAECLYFSGKKKASADQYAKALAKFPDSDLACDALYALAVARTEIGESTEAGSVWEEFLKRYPKDARAAEAVIRRAAIFSDEKKYNDAAALYASVAKRWPDSPWLRPAVLAAATCFFLDGKYSAAQRLFEQAAASGKTSDSEAAHWLVRCLIEQHQPVDAAAVAEKWIAALGNTPEAATLKADFVEAASIAAENRLQAGQWDEAEKRLTQLLEKNSDHPNAKRWRQQLLDLTETQAKKAYDDGDFAAAENRYDAWLALRPEDAQETHSLYNRGIARFKQKKYEDAAKDFQAIAAAKPASSNRFDALYMLGLCSAAEGKLSEAVASYRAILADDPNYAHLDQVLYQLGFALAAEGKHAASAEAFAELAKRQPDSPLAAELLYRQGEAAYAAGEFKKAAVAYHDTWERAGDAPLGDKATHMLGWCYFRQAKYSKAQQTFLFERVTWPTSSLAADATFLEGESWLRSGHSDAAIEAYRHLLDHYPKSDKAPLAERRIADLSE
jgi:TolA-binding protein